MPLPPIHSLPHIQHICRLKFVANFDKSYVATIFLNYTISRIVCLLLIIIIINTKSIFCPVSFYPLQHYYKSHMKEEEKKTYVHWIESACVCKWKSDMTQGKICEIFICIFINLKKKKNAESSPWHEYLLQCCNIAMHVNRIKFIHFFFVCERHSSNIFIEIHKNTYVHDQRNHHSWTQFLVFFSQKSSWQV